MTNIEENLSGSTEEVGNIIKKESILTHSPTEYVEGVLRMRRAYQTLRMAVKDIMFECDEDSLEYTLLRSALTLARCEYDEAKELLKLKK